MSQPDSTPEQRARALWDKIDEHVCRGGCACDWLDVDTEKAVARIADALREERALAIQSLVAEIEGECAGHSIELERLRTRAEWLVAEARQSK